jgi:hypothetical protein
VVVVGVALTNWGSAPIGALLVGSTFYAGVFVMARRIARLKNRSVGLATMWALLAGWLAVFV